MPSKRIEYIDAAKAIAIILMIVGHSYWKGAIPHFNGFIYSFHMPLFFIVSGMFWKESRLRTALPKYAKAYLWPYAILCLFILSADIIGCSQNDGNIQETLLSGVIKVIWASNCQKDVLFGDFPCIGAAWFLFALFWARSILTCISRFYTNRGGAEKALAVFMTASFALASIRYVEFPFSIQAGMLAMMFVYIGTLVKKYQLINVLFTISPTTKVLVCCFWLIVSACTGGVDIGSSSIGFSILGLLNSLFGFFITIGICIRFKLRFEWIGRNTIYILAGHILVYQYLSAL